MDKPCLCVCVSSEYTIMAESLERCFSRALLKHFPSEDGDTDEEFHVSKEERDRKDKKKSKNSRQSGPESLIRATEQVQKRKAPSSGKGGKEENKPKSAPLPPAYHYPSGPQNLHPGQPHPDSDPRSAMYQQARPHYYVFTYLHTVQCCDDFDTCISLISQMQRHPGPPPSGMYGQRMMFDPRYPYPGQRPHMTRGLGEHGTQPMPHYNMQV